MTYPTDHAGMEVLPFDRCLGLLASVPVGRIGFFADGELVILPVNHLVDGQDVVFRTAAGSKLSTAKNGDLVVFEADSFAPGPFRMERRGQRIRRSDRRRRRDRSAQQPWPASVDYSPWSTRSGSGSARCRLADGGRRVP